ncbi:transposase family protein [Nocardia sp. NPDC004168]|uniref:transposase family protein n=1 Tax=Nocardia sp. NPDC004168 TaxID=3154452 RepID=UPI0033A03D5C
MIASGVESVLRVLFPHLARVCIDGVEVRGSTVRFEARTSSVTGACPQCGSESDRVHSQYVRQLADRSVGGREARIQSQVKKFGCLNSVCPRKIFAEQPDGLAGRYQRRSTTLTDLLTRIGLALGGRAGQERPSKERSSASRYGCHTSSLHRNGSLPPGPSRRTDARQGTSRPPGGASQ